MFCDPLPDRPVIHHSASALLPIRWCPSARFAGRLPTARLEPPKDVWGRHLERSACGLARAPQASTWQRRSCRAHGAAATKKGRGETAPTSSSLFTGASTSVVRAQAMRHCERRSTRRSSSWLSMVLSDKHVGRMTVGYRQRRRWEADDRHPEVSVSVRLMRQMLPRAM